MEILISHWNNLSFYSEYIGDPLDSIIQKTVTRSHYIHRNMLIVRMGCRGTKMKNGDHWQDDTVIHMKDELSLDKNSSSKNDEMW